MFVISITLVVIVSLAVCLKRRNHNRTPVSAHVTNPVESDIVNNQDSDSEVNEEHQYNYPVVDPDDIHTIESTQNKSYGVSAVQKVGCQPLSKEDAYYNHPASYTTPRAV